ncbi:unnamed protein product [Linum tenue]|uniref:Protein kinase domain-containing protein n=1 Tax=Linum tenue TaxID=586396 RepID=A0AAV0GV79_9ROSI|nr:unnamed protein product [Linum tenue]
MRVVVNHPYKNPPSSPPSEIQWTRGELLGKGSYGEVFVGIPKTPNSPPLMAVKSAPEYDAESLKLERRILTNFRHNPNIIQCFGAQTTEHGGHRTYNLLLEYASGGSLSNFIAKRRRGIPEIHVRVCTRMILEALWCIHSRGYAHCDIKTDNILVFEEHQSLCRLKVADFGAAVEISKQSGGGEKLGIRGTVRYMAPEVAAAGKVTTAMDIWALGCTVVEMITGKRPWKGLEKEEVMARLAEGRHPDIPAGLSAEGRDFLEECFVTSGVKRATADSLLSHPFVARCDGSAQQEADIAHSNS